MVSIYIGYFPILFCLLTPTLELTLAVLTGNKLDPLKQDQIGAGGSAKSHSNVILETRCQMVSYPNGKIYNCSSSSPRTSRSGTDPLPEGRISQKKCGSNTRLVGESCLCNPGYRKFPFSEVCVKEEGGRCHFQKNDCSTDMTYMACINNVCACEDTDVFDPVSSRCVGKIGGLCYPGVKDCIANAECVNIGGSDTRSDLEEPSSSSNEYLIHPTNDIELSGRCECKEGYVESKEGFCKKDYGQMCNSPDECDSSSMVCKEGVCSCKNSLQVYDLMSRACVSLVGAPCSESRMCVKYSYCKTNLQFDGGRCACVENAVETKMRTCNPPLSTSASTHPQPTSDFLRDNRNEESSRVLFVDY